DGLLFEHQSPLAVLQHALRDVASLVGFLAHADELWSRGGVSIGPQVLGEALSPQTDHPICRCYRLAGAIVALECDDLWRRAELCRKIEDVADRRGAKGIN